MHNIPGFRAYLLGAPVKTGVRYRHRVVSALWWVHENYRGNPEPSVITKILDHFGLPVRVPPRAPAQIQDLFEST